jgi:hypothetical protein
MIFLFAGCGVSTDSSPDLVSTDTTLTTDSNTSVDDLNSTTNDENVTVGKTNTSSLTGGTATITVVDLSLAGFDKTGAVLDSKACTLDDTYSVIIDSSFDPNSVFDVVSGLEVSSKYDFTTDLEATNVALYYPKLTQPLLGQNVNIYEDYYRIGFDKAWYGNADGSVYVRTPKDSSNSNSCYRYALNSKDGTSITRTKVYR